MIYVTLVCAKSRTSCGPGCPQYDEKIDPEDAAAWFGRTVAEHGWTVHQGETYCPEHNPTDAGQVVEVPHHPAYAPLGESGWEARLPDSLDWDAVPIEIRPIRTGKKGHIDD